MGWRGIPILAALGVMGVARILYDPQPSSAPAAVAINTDDATDLSQVDFSPWLGPTTAPITPPTTMPLSDHTSDQPDATEPSAAASTDHLLTLFHRIATEKFQWSVVANQPLSEISVAANPFTTSAIDIDTASSSPNLGDLADGYFPEYSTASRGKSPDITPVAPLSDKITRANDPAFSIVGFDIPDNTPLPRPTSSLPPIPTPEPATSAMLLLLATLATNRPR